MGGFFTEPRQGTQPLYTPSPTPDGSHPTLKARELPSKCGCNAFLAIVVQVSGNDVRFKRLWQFWNGAPRHRRPIKSTREAKRCRGCEKTYWCAIEGVCTPPCALRNTGSPCVRLDKRRRAPVPNSTGDGSATSPATNDYSTALLVNFFERFLMGAKCREYIGYLI